jgi:hypothetical protein
MKAPDLKKWDIKPEIEGILFFAQLIDELLFDYTIDAYKIPALNSRTLALELLRSIEDYDVNVLRKGAIRPIVNELVNRLAKDAVIQEFIGDYFGQYIDSLNKEQPIPELKAKVIFLINKLEDKYFFMAKKHLKEAILNPKEKERITRLTRDYVIELIDKGYSPQFIYHESEKFFFSGRSPQKIDNPQVIDEYFNLFSAEKRKFHVIYRAGKSFNLIKGYSPNLGIEILEDVPELPFGGAEKVRSFLGKHDQCPLFLIVKNNEALDENIARALADQRLFLIDSLSKYHIHRGELQRSSETLIYSDDNKRFGVYRKPNSSVMKRPDRPFEKLSDLIKDTVAVITSDKLDPESFLRLVRALWRHNTAIRSEAPENQLLEFWSTVEVLFPPTAEESDRVLQIAGAMVCFEASAYAAKIAADLYKAIKNSHYAGALEILNEIPEGGNVIEKCLALFSIEENEPIRNKFYNLFEKHPLLKNRIYYLNTRFASANLVLKTLNAHIERVSWQIQRIYRARNVIVHSGKTLPYVNILVENLHSYIDRVLDLLNEKISRSSHSTTIDQIVLEVKLESESHLHSLRKLGKEKCTSDNYKLILFGNK